jgi:hypothetical protein
MIENIKRIIKDKEPITMKIVEIQAAAELDRRHGGFQWLVLSSLLIGTICGAIGFVGIVLL